MFRSVTSVTSVVVLVDGVPQQLDDGVPNRIQHQMDLRRLLHALHEELHVLQVRFTNSKSLVLVQFEIVDVVEYDLNSQIPLMSLFSGQFLEVILDLADREFSKFGIPHYRSLVG